MMETVTTVLEQTPAQWWEIVNAFGPLATLLSAIIIGGVAWRTLKQRSLADRKAQWWLRVQWALEEALSVDLEKQALGIRMIRVLGQADWLTEEELLLLDAAWKDPLSDAEPVDSDVEPADNSKTRRGVEVQIKGVEVKGVEVKGVEVKDGS